MIMIRRLNDDQVDKHINDDIQLFLTFISQIVSRANREGG